jgi:hypothetical protein
MHVGGRAGETDRTAFLYGKMDTWPQRSERVGLRRSGSVLREYGKLLSTVGEQDLSPEIPNSS